MLLLQVEPDLPEEDARFLRKQEGAAGWAGEAGAQSPAIIQMTYGN